MRFPAYYFPTKLGPKAKGVYYLYLPLPYAVMPLAQTLGFWVSVGVTSRPKAIDELERPLR